MLKKILKTIGVLMSLILFWFLLAWLLPKIKVDSQSSEDEKTVTIYVRSNGVHTDIVMPKTNMCYNWNTFIDTLNFPDVDSAYHYIAIGWGDKGFYLNTPTWADVKCKTVVNAMFGFGSTAMHVTYYKKMVCGDHVKQIKISKADYLNLVSHITQSFELTEQKPQIIEHPGYGKHDNYFDANGTYSIFKTCNVWTGNTLKEANIPMGLWTPLEFGIMENL